MAKGVGKPKEQVLEAKPSKNTIVAQVKKKKVVSKQSLQVERAERGPDIEELDTTPEEIPTAKQVLGQIRFCFLRGNFRL
jgi:hypothetical protein